MVVGEFTRETNLVVVGGGPGGYTSAFRAAELGVETVIVDPRPSLGGVCLHEGCVPSKTLLSLADTIAAARAAASQGVTFAEPTIDPRAMHKWVKQSVDTLGSGLASLAKKHGVEHIQGEARFEDGKHIVVHGENSPPQRLKFRRAIIATGAVPIALDQAPFDDNRILSPAAALWFDDVPKRLLIIGGDYHAIELATIYATLGSRVTLVASSAPFLADADADLSRVLMRGLKESLHRISDNVSISGAKVTRDGVKLSFQGDAAPPEQLFDRVIIALGHRANVDRLGLELTKVKRTCDGWIEIDDRLCTSDPRILAVGDVTGPPLLAHRAMHQGRIAAEIVAGWNSSLDARAIPQVVFSNPQLAWTGVTESQAKAANLSHEVRRIPWGASGRAVGMGRTDGMTKLIVDPDTQLVLGVGIVGAHAAEMIGEAVLAIEMGAVVEDLAAIIHPHPTLCELLGNAATTQRGSRERDSKSAAAS
jgi:dihydrolipoamide dehydrogenase